MVRHKNNDGLAAGVSFDGGDKVLCAGIGIREILQIIIRVVLFVMGGEVREGASPHEAVVEIREMGHEHMGIDETRMGGALMAFFFCPGTELAVHMIDLGDAAAG